MDDLDPSTALASLNPQEDDISPGDALKSLPARSVDPSEALKSLDDAKVPTRDEQKIGVAMDHYRQYAEHYWGTESDDYALDRLPGVGLGRTLGKAYDLSGALERYKKGEHTDGDLFTIAEAQAKQEYQAKRAAQGIGTQAFDFATRAPGMIAEFAASGGATSAIGKGVATRLGGSVAARAAGFGAQTAAMTALTPSMYVEQAASANIKQGRDPLDPRGLAPAYGLAAAQMAVLGKVGELTGKAFTGDGFSQAVGRIGVQAATGPFAQAAADVVTSFAGLDTGYGSLGKLLEGDPKGALQKAVMDSLNFATFGTGHEIASGGKGRAVAKDAAEQIKTSLDEQAKQGATPDQAAAVLQEQLKQKLAGVADAQEPANAPPTAPATPEQAKSYPKWSDEDLIGFAKGLGMKGKKEPTRADAEGFLKRGGISEDIVNSFQEAPKQAQVIQPEKPPEAPPASPAPEVAQKPAEVAPAESPVGKAFGERFSGAEATPRSNEWKAEFGGRTVYALHDPETNNVRLDFSWTDKAPLGTPKSGPRANVSPTVQPESRELIRKLKGFFGDMKDAGVGVEYTAQDGRAEVYHRMMEKAGFEQATGPENPIEGTAQYSWKPKAEEPLAKTDPLRETLDVPGATATDKLHAVFSEAGLTPNEKYALVEKAKGRTFDDIARDKEMLGRVYTRQRVKQFEQSARQKVEEYTGRQFKSIYEEVNQADRESSKQDAGDNTKVTKDAKDVVDYAESAGWAPDPEAHYQDSWLEYLERNSESRKALSSEQHAHHDASVAKAIENGEKPPEHGLVGSEALGAERKPIGAPSVRSESAGAVQPNPAQRPEAQAPQVQGPQGIGASANAGKPEAAGNELRPLPPKTQARLNEMVSAGDRVGVEDLKEALQKHREYSDEEIRQARQLAGKYPKGVEGPARPPRLGTWDMQVQGEARKYGVKVQLAQEIAEHLDPKETADVVQNFQRSGNPPAETSGLIEQAVSQGQSEGREEGRSKGIERVARETGHDPEELSDLLEREAIENEHAPTGAESPSDIPFRREPGTAEPITGGRDFGRPVTPEERQGLPGGGQPDAGEAEAPKKFTALQNSEVDKERVKNGLPPLMEAARQSNPETWDRAMAKLDKDPEAGAKLVEELAKKPRPTTVEENALLLQRKIALSNEHKRAMLDYIQAFKEKADAITMSTAEGRERDLFDKIDQLDKVARETGTEWGRAGQFRRQLAAEDFSLGKMLLDAQTAKGRPLTPEERLKIAELSARIEDLQKQLDEAQDKLKGAKLGTKAFTDWNRARVASKKATGEWQDSLQGDRDANKPIGQRMEDWLVKLRRAFVISSPTTMAKIAAASAERLGIAPIEEAVGGALSQLPGLSKIAAVAPREGGASLKTEGRAFASAWGQGMIDAWETLKTGKSELDVLFGKDKGPRSWMDWVGELHAAAKAPAVRAEFTRSFLKRVDSEIAQSKDPTTPAALIRIGTEAYKDSQRAKFQQDNRVVDAYNKAVATLTAKDAGAGSRALGTGLKLALPVVKIPTNLVAETMQYATGLVTGSAKAGLALRAGVENLKPGEADVIMRSLKKGSLGAAVLALGYFNPQSFGGYYSGKRKEDDVAAGGIKTSVGTIPSWALHNPLLEVAQMGSTIRRASDKLYKGHDQGTVEGIGEGIAGLAKEIPFAREAEDVAGMVSTNPRERGYHFGEFAKSLAVPQLVQWMAGQTDRNAKGELQKRKPTTVMQHIETGIPGLRQTVPR